MAGNLCFLDILVDADLLMVGSMSKLPGNFDQSFVSILFICFFIASCVAVSLENALMRLSETVSLTSLNPSSDNLLFDTYHELSLAV